jgi:hypothetical protein
MKDYLSTLGKKKVCGVNELFNTASGLVAIIDFPEGFGPKVGMILKNSSAKKWRIKGIAMPKPIDRTNFKFTPRFNNWIYDCLLEPLEHSDVLNENDILEVD